ncbi:MFS transporter [Virgibacillus dokdonensis]|uniref:MFS transporter n=1 Tax=Virgibacillus dokdonensis TaxID=302167 RepID=UPI00158FA5E0|nr:MFS transporter [Virgibacillus dokdonensis]
MNKKIISLYVTGIGFSEIGKWVFLVAINLKVLAISNSPFSIAILYSLTPLSSLLTNIWSGRVIDRIDKKIILMTINVLRSILIIMVFFTDNIYLIYLFVFFVGVAGAFFGPTSNVFITNNVPQDFRKKFNSILSSVTTGALMTGPALAGIIIAGYNIDFAIFITSLLFLVCSFFIFLIPNNESRKEIERVASSKLAILLSDFRTVRGYFIENKYLLKIIVLFNVSMVLIFSLDSQEATYIKNNLLATERDYGLLMSLAGIGSVVGSIVSTYTPNSISIKHYLGIGSMLGSIGYILFYSSPNIIIAGISFVVLGFFLAYASIGYMTFFQNNIPKEVMGRVGSVIAMIQGAFQIIITFIIGVFSTLISLKVTTVLFSLVALIIAIKLYSIIMNRSNKGVIF